MTSGGRPRAFALDGGRRADPQASPLREWPSLHSPCRDRLPRRRTLPMCGALAAVLCLFALSAPPDALAATNDVFTNAQPWTKDVSALPKSASSDQIISTLVSLGGFGKGYVQMDFSLNVVEAPAGTTKRSFQVNDDFWAPDCDCAAIPVPAVGAVEGSNTYTCPGYDDGDDCHLLVVDRAAGRLYEVYRATISSGQFLGGCLAVWNLGAPTYPVNLRGTDCTSADAGGFPMTAMLFNADEVAAGSINHALRFTLPNSRIARRLYVNPGSHSTPPTSGPATAPPYGVRFRLKANYDISGFSAGAQVIARALKKYGMFLADGGTIALTGQSDLLTTAKWAALGVNEQSLTALVAQDFEVVDMGELITYTGDCVRNSQPAFAPVGVLSGSPPAVCDAGATSPTGPPAPVPTTARATSKKVLRTTKQVLRQTTKRRRTTSRRRRTTSRRRRTSTRRKKTTRKIVRTTSRRRETTKAPPAPAPATTARLVRATTKKIVTTQAPPAPTGTGSLLNLAPNQALRGWVLTPSNLAAIGDDRVATLEWDKPSPYHNFDMGRPVFADDFRNRYQFYDHSGYVVSWGVVGEADVHKIYTPFSITMIQPLTPGVTYWAYVQATSNNGTITGPSNTVYFSHDSSRVDALRQAMTGFFDDFNTPAGPLDETKWNQASSLCSDVNYTFAFVNDQFHAHQSISSPITCEKGLNILRPRNTFDFTGRTGTVVFDFDASVSQTNWYLDLMAGERIDFEGQIHIADVDNPGAPTNMLRIRSNMGDDQALAVLFFGADGIMRVVQTAQMDVLGVPLVRNVRRPFVVKISKSRLEVTVSGVKVIDTPIALPYERGTLHFTQYSYDTVAADEPFATIHWDNFGFDGAPAQFVTRNYPTVTPRLEYDIWGGDWLFYTEFSKWYPGNTKPMFLSLPDPLTGISAARLHFTVFATYNPATAFGPLNTVSINGTLIGPIPIPVEGNLPIGAITTFEAGRAIIMPLDPALVSKLAGPAGGGAARIEFNVMEPDSRLRIGAVHIEVDYPPARSAASVPYTPPVPVFGQLDAAGKYHPVYKMRGEAVGPNMWVKEIRPGLFEWYYNAMFLVHNPKNKGLELPLSSDPITLVGMMYCDSEITAYGKANPLVSVTLYADNQTIPTAPPLILPGTQTYGRFSFTFATADLPGAAHGKTVELWPDVRSANGAPSFTSVRLQGIEDYLGSKSGEYRPFRIYLK